MLFPRANFWWGNAKHFWTQVARGWDIGWFGKYEASNVASILPSTHSLYQLLVFLIFSF